MRYNKEKKVKKEVTAAMNHTARKVSMYTLMALLLVATAVMVFLSVLSYDRTTQREARAAALGNMSARIESRAKQLRLILEDRLDALEGVAGTLQERPGDAEDLATLLRAPARAMGLQWLCFAGADGQAVRDDGEVLDLSGLSCFQRALAGESLLCDGEGDYAGYLLLAVPVGDGEGALLGMQNMAGLGRDLFPGGINVCLLRADGRILTAAPESPLANRVGENLYDMLQVDGAAAEAVSAGETTIQRGSSAMGDFYAVCVPLGTESNWLLCGLIPVSALETQFSFVNEAAFVLEARLGLCALVLIALVAWFSWASNRRLRAEKLRLEWSEERYRILAEDSNEVIWEYDVLNDRLRLGENFAYIYGHEGAHTIEELLDNAHPQEREHLAQVFNALRTGAGSETHATVDFRVRMGALDSARYTWCRAHMSVLFDGRRRRRWIIGKLTDISQERLNAERLEKRARTDALTGLLNRAGLEDAIRMRLESGPRRRCAVVLLDIDDFKEINDFYGHDVGDDVLRTLADFLRGHFRGTDIVGRLGGDEFMALMEGVDSAERLMHALTRLKQGLARLHAGEVRVGCSAGAALFPENGDSFDALYKSADVALYNAKRAGKGRFSLFAEEADFSPTPQALEHMEYAAYVVDPRTRELLFANAKMCARFPNLRPGEKCYRALMDGAEAPCEGCDAKALLAQAREGAADGGALCGEWLRASLTPVRWPDGREALLFTCKRG